MSAKQKIYGVFLLLACLLSLACADDEARLANDTSKTAELRQLNSKLDSGVRLSTDEFAALKSLYQAFPQSATAGAVYEKALNQRKDWGTLAEFYETSIKEKPESAKKLAQVYLKLGRYRDAYTIARDLDLESDPAMRRVATRSLFQTGDYGEAKKLIDKEWDTIVNGKDVDGMAIRGMIYFYENEDQKALQVLQSVIEIAPDNVMANNGLSRIYASRGDSVRAAQALARVQDAFDKITAEEGAKTRYVEKIYRLQDDYKNKRFEEVIVVGKLLAAEADDQQRLIVYQYLYNSYKAMGNEQEARAILEKARRLKEE